MWQRTRGPPAGSQAPGSWSQPAARPPPSAWWPSAGLTLQDRRPAAASGQHVSSGGRGGQKQTAGRAATTELQERGGRGRGAPRRTQSQVFREGSSSLNKPLDRVQDPLGTGCPSLPGFTTRRTRLAAWPPRLVLLTAWLAETLDVVADLCDTSSQNSRGVKTPRLSAHDAGSLACAPSRQAAGHHPAGVPVRRGDQTAGPSPQLRESPGPTRLHTLIPHTSLFSV